MKNLPPESIDALARSLRSVVRDMAGLEIGVACEDFATPEGDLTMFVITVPADAPLEQRVEADYWIHETVSFFRYSDPSSDPYPDR